VPPHPLQVALATGRIQEAQIWALPKAID